MDEIDLYSERVSETNEENDLHNRIAYLFYCMPFCIDRHNEIKIQ